MIARDISGGDLTAAVTLRPGDHGSLMASIEQMRSQLTMIVNGIKNSTETISVASGEIARGNFDLSQRTDEQTASLSSVQRFSEIMNNIAGASSEQTTGIEQVNTAIVQMDLVTQQNVALVAQVSVAVQA